MFRTLGLFFMMLVVAESVSMSRAEVDFLLERAQKHQESILDQYSYRFARGLSGSSEEASSEESSESSSTGADESSSTASSSSSTGADESSSTASVSSSSSTGAGESNSTDSASSTGGTEEVKDKQLFKATMTFAKELNSTQEEGLKEITAEKTANSLGVAATDILVTITKTTSRRLLSVSYDVVVALKAAKVQALDASALTAVLDKVTTSTLDSISAEIVTAAEADPALADAGAPTVSGIEVTVVPETTTSSSTGGGGNGGGTKFSAADRTTASMSVAVLVGLVALL